MLRVDVAAICERLVGRNGVAEDGDERGGYEVGPADLPVDTQLNAQHELDVVDEPVQAVHPAHSHRLYRGLCDVIIAASKILPHSSRFFKIRS